MVLLIGNFPPDRQHSMLRFGDLMLSGLRAAGVEAELVRPMPLLANLAGGVALLQKWLGYVDKYLLFRFTLRRQIARSPTIIHICDHSNSMYVASRQSKRCVVTCHDLIAVRSGLGEETGCPLSFTGRLLQRWILRWLRRADAVVCVSSATARDVDELVRRGGERPSVQVVPLALNYGYAVMDPDAAGRELVAVRGLGDKPFALHVGSNLVRKNRKGLLRIFARCQDRWAGQLVVAGEPLDDELRQLAADLGITRCIIEVPDPSPALLKALYNKAIALLFPSTFEGFGWPIIEAQACGCPVVCSNVGPMPEAAGEAGLLHDPADEQGFADDLIRLTTPEERARWSAKSLQNAQRFSTDRMISRYIEIYRQLGAPV